jgi:5-methyltetrahydropteroyltriglutamate--homocysteine methyltransferase
VKTRVEVTTKEDAQRNSPFAIRKKLSKKYYSFLCSHNHYRFISPNERVRNWRAKFKKGELNAEQYDTLLKQETERTIRWQEEIGIDVLVHGEFERNDMVEYFGEQLEGFVLLKMAGFKATEAVA